MEMIRRGTKANYGTRSALFKRPLFSWNKSDAQLTIKGQGIQDFNTKSKHNYEIRLNLQEMAQLIQALSEAAITDPLSIENGLRQSLKPLLRIQAAIVGVNNNY